MVLRMRLFPSIKNLTREQLEERFDKAAAQFLRSRDAESRREVIELHDRLKELDDEKRAQIPVLQLRDHRLMKRQSGHVVWPPVWKKIGDDVLTITGEVGYLEQVHINAALKASLFLPPALRASEVQDRALYQRDRRSGSVPLALVVSFQRAAIHRGEYCVEIFVWGYESLCDVA